MNRVFISIPVSTMTAANAAASANFDDSVDIFQPNASNDGKLPATHCVCAVNTTPEAEVQIQALVDQLGGKLTKFDADPFEAWTAHGLNPIFNEKP